MNLLDLHRAIANYYASTDHEIETTYTIRPDRETYSDLPQEKNEEGDVIYVKDDGYSYIWDEGEWVQLPSELFKDDALLTKDDINKAIDEALDNDGFYASEEEILDEILKGVEAADD